MESLLITPNNKKQAQLIKDFVEEMGLQINVLSEEDKEDKALLRAMKAGEKDKRNVRLKTFLDNLQR